MEYLQDQLHLKNVEANCVAEHVHSLELKLSEFRKLSEKVHQMRNDYLKSESDRLILMQELEQNKLDLQDSARCINKLEATISSNTLEFQCEIETLMLDLSACEEKCAQAEGYSEQCTRETARMASLLSQLDIHLLEGQQMINRLKNEKESLQERLGKFKQQTISFCCKLDEYINEQEKDCSQWRTNMSSHPSVSIALDDSLPIEKEMCIGEEIFGPLLSKMAVVRCCDKKLLEKRERVTSELSVSKLVKKLQEELRAEKCKAKEDAEDLAQEMAELRYNTTELLEEERKRHAFIEQASLLRIKELEANVCDEHQKFLAAERHLFRAEELSESRYKEILRLNDTLLNLQTGNDLKTIVQRVETCTCGACGLSEPLNSSHTS
ncbi:uncharacterized protein LOC116257042 isoform X2 [Nymphaea colorata]|nr:uncharacterized protein LOC116257042 isoform X2 [Nymphaea colorata]